MLHDRAANAVFASSAWGPSKPSSPLVYDLALLVVSTALPDSFIGTTLATVAGAATPQHSKMAGAR